jgi:peptidoglycan/xylan/chitin deacetylase (PgdA/CDA1 family)
VLREGLDHTRDLIADTCDVSPQAICYVRPPYGFFTARTVALLSDWGYRLVLWNSIPLHWIQPMPWTIKRIVNVVHPGSVIVLHDGKGHGLRVAQIVDSIVPTLTALDFVFIKVETMKGNPVCMSSTPSDHSGRYT